MCRPQTENRVLLRGVQSPDLPLLSDVRHSQGPLGGVCGKGISARQAPRGTPDRRRNFEYEQGAEQIGGSESLQNGPSGKAKLAVGRNRFCFWGTCSDSQAA